MLYTGTQALLSEREVQTYCTKKPVRWYNLKLLYRRMLHASVGRCAAPLKRQSQPRVTALLDGGDGVLCQLLHLLVAGPRTNNLCSAQKHDRARDERYSGASLSVLVRGLLLVGLSCMYLRQRRRQQRAVVHVPKLQRKQPASASMTMTS